VIIYRAISISSDIDIEARLTKKGRKVFFVSTVRPLRPQMDSVNEQAAIRQGKMDGIDSEEEC
jgi:hypothetical protein